MGQATRHPPCAPRGWAPQRGGKSGWSLNLLFHLRQVWPLWATSLSTALSLPHTHAPARTHTRTHKHCFLATLELLSTVPQGHRGRCWGSHPPTALAPGLPTPPAPAVIPAHVVLIVSLIHYPVSPVRKRGHRGVKECSGRTELGFRPRQSGLRVCARNYYTPPPPWMDETFSSAGME